MVTRLYAGEKTGLFIDKTGEINETIKLETEAFYICYTGFPSLNSREEISCHC